MILCKWTVHLWYDHHCTSFCWITFGLWQTLIFCNTNAVLEKQQQQKRNKIFLVLWLKSCTGFHCCISTCLPFLSLFIFWISQSRLQLLLFLLKYWFRLIPDWYLSLSSPSTLLNRADVCNLSAYFICGLISPLSKMKEKKRLETDGLPVYFLFTCQSFIWWISYLLTLWETEWCTKHVI